MIKGEKPPFNRVDELEELTGMSKEQIKKSLEQIREDFTRIHNHLNRLRVTNYGSPGKMGLNFKQLQNFINEESKKQPWHRKLKNKLLGLKYWIEDFLRK